ncbi:MAG: MATE family efflux transporter, partial [Alphaproteobacteria bacterium]
ILAIALPIIIANITTPLIGIVDTAVLGQLGDPHYIGAVAVGAMIFNMIYWAFGFLRMGTTGITAQAEGSGDRDEVAATLIRTLLIAGSCGIALILLQGPIAYTAFSLIEGSAPVEAEAATYFTLRIWGAPAALANYALLGWFIGRGRAGTALQLQLLLNGANVILDALFVLVFEWGVAGVAIGTLISEVFAAVCGLWLARRMLRHAGAVVTRERTFDARALKRIVSVNADIMIRTLCLLFALSWFTAKSAETNDVILAANAILLNFAHFAAYFLDGFAFSTETLVGQAIGARRKARFREAIWMSSQWAVVLSVLLGAAFLAFGGLYIDLLTINAEVRAAARQFLFWAAISPIVGVWCFLLDGIFVGATRTADMRNMMIVSLAVYLLAWLVLTDLHGNHGLWAALNLFWLVRAITLASRLPGLQRAAFAGAA